MLREQLISRATAVLDEYGWTTCLYHGCFDIAARKQRLLLLKVLSNIDAMQTESANNLKIVSANIDAAALVIGESTSRERLAGGVVYERMQLPVLSIETFEQMISNDAMPAVLRDRGGLYVEIDSNLLVSARKKAGLSQAELADAVGISKKTIYSHESGHARALLSVVQHIEAVLNTKITSQPDVLKPSKYRTSTPKDKLEREIGQKLEKLGFETKFVGQAPFNIFAKERILLLSDIEKDRRSLLRRAPALKSFISTVKERALLITERSRDEEMFGIPVVEREELSDFDSPKELLRLAKRRTVQ